MTVNVGWLDPSQDCWDTNMLQLLTNKNGQELYPTGLKFRHCKGFPPHVDGAIVVVPGQYFHQHTDYINDSIAVFDWCLLVRTSDEEDLFDVGKLRHGNLKVWLQTPRVNRSYGDARLFGVGFPPHFNDLPVEPPRKKYDVFISGQETHQRRLECFRALRWNMKPSWVVDATDGFTRGMPAVGYAAGMVEARVAPCPSGAVSPDSFRFWEALEAHAVPIADTVSPVDGVTDYWRELFVNPPFPILDDYIDLQVFIDEALELYPRVSNQVAAWWMREKRRMAMALRGDLQDLGAL